MEKLSEAGRLYLKDIYILEEARKDAFDYLNFIVDQVFEKWEEYKDEQKLFNKSDKILWGTWKSKGNPGKIELYPGYRNLQESKYFSEGDYGLVIQYLDARHNQKLMDTVSISIHLSFTNIFWRKVKQLPSAKLAQALAEARKDGLELDIENKIPFSMQIKINLDDTSATIEEITESLVEKCKGLETFFVNCL